MAPAVGRGSDERGVRPSNCIAQDTVVSTWKEIEEQQRTGWPANWRQLTAGVRRGEARQGRRQQGRLGTVEVEARQRTGGGRRRA
uniref:Uncharacterized protein n=1 Tax=Arundo donax TaxID=35708 RepID=A0A0A9DUE2_ARUDO